MQPVNVLCSRPRCESGEAGKHLYPPAALGGFVWLRESGAATKCCLKRNRLFSEHRTFGVFKDSMPQLPTQYIYFEREQNYRAVQC